MSSDLYKQIAEAIIQSQQFKDGMMQILEGQIATAMRQQAVGERLYIAKNNREDIKQRNQMIAQQFTGRNLEQLAKQFNMTPRQIRRVLKTTK